MFSCMRADCDVRDREEVLRVLKDSCKGSRVSALRSLVGMTGGVFLFWCTMPMLTDDEARMRRAGVSMLKRNTRNSSLMCHPLNAKRIKRFLLKQNGVRRLQKLRDADGNYVFLFKGDAALVMRALRENGIRGWTVS